MTQRSRSVGIDLGTTNSVVAVLEGGEPAVIPNAEGARTTPSVAAFAAGDGVEGQGNVLVGELAKRQAVTNVDRTVRSVKRQMGTDWRIELDGASYTPQQMSAHVLRKLKRDAETYLGEPVSDAVITVPAYFSDAARQATKEAGEIAGLTVSRIVNEPTAAALAYGLDQDGPDRTVLVFDLGGGTFDVSLLEIGEGVFEVKATSGDNRLGGDDWDGAIVDWLVERFRAEHGVDLGADRIARQRLIEAAERAKIELSGALETAVHLPYVTHGGSGPLHLEEKLTRADFERLTSRLLDRCRQPFERVLADADLTPDRIDDVILVGGSTRMPAVVDLVRELSGGRESRRGVHPDEVVAVGASLQAGVLSGEVKDVLLLDVTPLSLGIAANQSHGNGGIFAKIIERNTTIPTRKTELFTTGSDQQDTVPIEVYQGERAMAGDNTHLGTFELTGLPPAPRGVPKIEVAFDIDADGIVHVAAKDLGTGREQTMVVSGGSALPREKIEAMVREAEEYAESDRRRRESADLRVAADSQAYQTERFLVETVNTEVGAQLPAEDREAVERDLVELRERLAGEDDDALRAAHERLQESRARLGAALYAGAGGAAGGAEAAGGAGAPRSTGPAPRREEDDEVVDAEVVDDGPGRDG